jgi:hypothetical protein
VGNAGHIENVAEAEPPVSTSASWSFDPCQAPIGVIKDGSGAEVFRFGRTGTAVLLLPTWPAEQQRTSTLTPTDLLALTDDQDVVWPIFEAVRRLDGQRLNEWTLAERQRDAHGVASSFEQEHRQCGRDGELDGGYVECAPRIAPSRSALVAGDHQGSATVRQEAFRQVLSRDLSADRESIGQCVRTALQRWEGFALARDALTGYWHLAARLGRAELDDYCEDGQGKNRRLRVCQLKGHVFRARSARYHPNLPREPIQVKLGSHHVAGYVGPFWKPADPFGSGARAVRLYAPCQECGDLFTADTSKREYCDACSAPAARKARSRRITRAG